MVFEYDDNKSKSNKEKHGIDFVEAEKLWLQNHVLYPAGPVKGAYMNNPSEPRNNQEFDAYFEDNDISMLLDTKQKRVKYWISEKLGIIN